MPWIAFYESLIAFFLFWITYLLVRFSIAENKSIPLSLLAAAMGITGFMFALYSVLWGIMALQIGEGGLVYVYIAFALDSVYAIALMMGLSFPLRLMMGYRGGKA